MSSEFSPETFNQYYNSFFNYNLSLFELINKIHENSVNDVLDLACGTGLTTRALAKKFPNANILGIDSDRQLIQYANMAHKPINVDYTVLNVEHCEKLDKKFDMIIIKSALHLIHEEYIFDDYLNILNSKGKFYAIERTENSVNSFPIFKQAKELWKKQYDSKRRISSLKYYFENQNYEIKTYRFGQKVLIDKDVYINGIKNKEMSCLWEFDNKIIDDWIQSSIVANLMIEVFEEYDIYAISKN